MKKFIAVLFLSLFVSQINAAMMPVDLSSVGGASISSDHEHCQEASSISSPQDGKTSAPGATHYCCAVVAILMTPSTFSAPKQGDVYLHGNVVMLTSNIAESIYKPPKTYL